MCPCWCRKSGFHPEGLGRPGLGCLLWDSCEGCSSEHCVSQAARAAAWNVRGWELGPPGPHHCPVSSCTGFLDWVPKKMQRVGCVELLNTVQRRVQPRLHVFGHIHEGQWVEGDLPCWGS